MIGINLNPRLQIPIMGRVNPYVDKIFGEWFKNIIILVLLCIGGVILWYGIPQGWIDQSFAVEMLFLIAGLILGRWLGNGKV